MADSDEGPELRQITFGDLALRIAEFQRRAKGTGKGPAWERLAELNRELAGTGASSDGLIDGRRWSLGELTVRGFQGVGESEPFRVDFEAGPGITVVHGQNGSGKTSVTDAIDLVLRGELKELDRESRKSLWERTRLNRDSVGARIDLTLRSGTAELRLGVELDRDGRRGERRAAMRLFGEDWKPVDTGQAWRAALVSHPPVFAYAEIERQVQEAKDLGDYLNGLLALGLCFGALRNRVTEQANAAVAAHGRLVYAQRLAAVEVQAVDDKFARPDDRNLGPVAWPVAPQDIDEWLASEELLEEGQAHVEVAANAEQVLADAAEVAEGRGRGAGRLPSARRRRSCPGRCGSCTERHRHWSLPAPPVRSATPPELAGWTPWGSTSTDSTS